MWPFKKKINIEATCSSGVLTCDGRHHVWSQWKRTTTPYSLRNTKTGEFYSATAYIQERTCIVCGFTEQKALDGSTL